MKYFCVLLKSDKKRLNHVISHVLKEIPSLRIIPAIEGKTNQLEYYLQNRKINEKFLKFCKRGQLACLLSHLEIWKIMVEEENSYSKEFLDEILTEVDLKTTRKNRILIVKIIKKVGTNIIKIKIALKKALISK